MKSNRILPLFILSLFSTNNHCMQKLRSIVLKRSTAILTTGLTAGTLCSYLAYLDGYIQLKDNKFKWNNLPHHTKKHLKEDLLPLSTLAIVIPGALLFSRTPKSFLLRAVRKFNKRDTRLLNIIKYKTPEELSKNLNDYYLQSELPMVQAFADLKKLLQESRKIVQLLEKAKTFKDYPQIVKDTNLFLSEFDDEYFNNIARAMLFIKNEPAYTPQNAAFQLQNAANANKTNAAANIVNAAVNTLRTMKPY